MASVDTVRGGAVVNVVNVVAIQRGTVHPDRYVIMTGDIDSRPSNGNDGTTDAPGANDNASGMAGVLETARLLTRHRFPSTVVYAGLSGEEQGLFGGRNLATQAKEQGWDIVAALNNDMIGNIEGINGVVDNTSFRVFSEPVPAPTNVRIGGAVSASTTLAWDAGAADPNLAGYRIYWRDTTEPRWTNSRFVGKLSRFTLENMIIDNYFFGVAAVGTNGTESPVVFAGVPMR